MYKAYNIFINNKAIAKKKHKNMSIVNQDAGHNL